MKGKQPKDKVVVFSTTADQFEALQALASTRDSLSSLMREIVREFLSKQNPSPKQASHLA